MSDNESVPRSARMLSPRRFVSEAVAIFLGVAAALAGQAWFEERADRLVERDLLNNVIVELAANEARISGGLDELRGWRMEVQSFARFVATEATRADADSVAESAWDLVRSSGPAIVTAATDEALRTGNLRLIEAAEVKTELVRLRDGMRRVVELVDDHQDWSNQVVRGFLTEQGAVGYHYGSLEALGGPLPPSRFSSAGVELLSSRPFENIIRDKTLWLLEIEGSMDAHVGHSARVRELIEAYVGAR